METPGVTGEMTQVVPAVSERRSSEKAVCPGGLMGLMKLIPGFSDTMLAPTARVITGGAALTVEMMASMLDLSFTVLVATSTLQVAAASAKQLVDVPHTVLALIVKEAPQLDNGAATNAGMNEGSTKEAVVIPVGYVKMEVAVEMSQCGANSEKMVVTLDVTGMVVTRSGRRKSFNFAPSHRPNNPAVCPEKASGNVTKTLKIPAA